MIRDAKPNDAKVLTELSYKSKGYWNYPQEYIDIWEKELTITSQYINDNQVFVFEKKDKICAYYSLVLLDGDVLVSNILLEKGCWLDHMFIKPCYIRTGIGRKLFKHMVGYCSTNNISQVNLLADPHAQGFYERMGCTFIKEYSSTVAGRTTPLMIYLL